MTTHECSEYECQVMVQITHNLNGPRVSHAWGEKTTHAWGFLSSTRVYTHTQYLHTCVFTRVHACMANVAS